MKQNWCNARQVKLQQSLALSRLFL